MWAAVSNHLKMAEEGQIYTLLELGWSHQRIAQE
jgi:hypothetical protein